MMDDSDSPEPESEPMAQFVRSLSTTAGSYSELAVDLLAPKLANMERVVLVKTELSEKEIIEKLRSLK